MSVSALYRLWRYGSVEGHLGSTPLFRGGLNGKTPTQWLRPADRLGTLS